MGLLSKSLFILVILFFSIVDLQSACTLSVIDARVSRYSYPGSIEEMLVTVHPLGTYTEMSLYLTFSARGSGVTNKDSLEIQLMFDLPQNSIVNDSWLWIDQFISKAFLIDRWTASQIYEGYVKRRIDPSLFIMKDQVNFEFHVFPLIPTFDDTLDPFARRRVMINYLVPNTWTAKNVISLLPINILKASKTNPSKIQITAYTNSDFDNPNFPENPDVTFHVVDSNASGKKMVANLSYAQAIQIQNIAFDSPMKKGLYLNTFTKDNENFYQMAMVPALALDFSISKKLNVLVDYDATKTDLKQMDVVNNLRTALLTNLTPKDSFNLVFSNLDISPVSPKWLPADSATILNTFNNLPSDLMTNYSNLPTLLAKGIEFINVNKDSAYILLVSNSDQFGGMDIANRLISDIKKMLKPGTVFNVADFGSKNISSYSIGNINYYGNEYLYINLTKYTGGSLSQIKNTGSALPNLLTTSFGNLFGSIKSFDLYTTTQDGFCYGRFQAGMTSQDVSYNGTILEIGKYNGTLPFDIFASGFNKSIAFTKKLTITQSDCSSLDFSLNTLWTGNYIRSLENITTKTNDINLEIINQSIDNRILSINTAFLALEEKDTINTSSDDNNDNGQLTIVSDMGNNVSNIKFTASPNPFSSVSNIKIEFSNNEQNNINSVKIFNIMGQEVKSIDFKSILSGNTLNINWNGDDANGQLLPNGVYILVLTTPNNRCSYRIVIMR
ncbi:MAG: T9SS type A sorting domain-containing protein [FCB group bacterium]|jgi:hypothetical protein